MFGGKKRNERSGKTGSCHMQMQQCGLSDHQAYPTSVTNWTQRKTYTRFYYNNLIR